MRKSLCTIAIILLFFAIYGGLWFYTASKTKSLLQKIPSYAKFYGIEFTYDDIATYGFPFNLKLHVKNPRFTAYNTQSISVKSDSILLKYRPLSKWLSIYFPSNAIDIAVVNNQEDSITYSDIKLENYNVVCNADGLAFISRLNKLPFLLQIKSGSGIADYINLLRYEDRGLNCTALSSSQENIGTRISQGNHLQLAFDKKSDEHVKLNIDSHISKYTEIKNQVSNNYPDIDVNFDLEILSGQSFAKLNFDIGKFLINGDDFSININGQLHDLTMSTFSHSFRDEVNIDMLNYKKCISFLVDRYSLSSDSQAINDIQELVFNAAQKINDNDVRITLNYNDNDRAVFIGNMRLDNFIGKVREIYSVEEKNVNKDENTDN